MSSESIEQFLFRGAELCDKQDWDAYLELYDEQSEFHVPQWDSEHVYTTDPKSEMSLIYYSNRAGLEDRVFRLNTGLSSASTPLARTVHMLSNIRTQKNDDGTWLAKANWVTHYFVIGEAGHFFGWSEYTLRPEGNSWKIVRKHAVILNDTIKHVLDFYHL